MQIDNCARNRSNTTLMYSAAILILVLLVPTTVQTESINPPVWNSAALHNTLIRVMIIISSIDRVPDQERSTPPVRPARQVWAMDAEIPANTIMEILRLQSHAVVLSDDRESLLSANRKRGIEQVHIRGGRAAETAFMIDGMQVTNLTFGGMAAEIDPYSVSQMVIMEGGMSAEFGNALSGVVNLITTQGGRQLEGNVELASSELTGRTQDDHRDLTRARGFLGGPIIGPNRLTFFLSGSAATRRDYLVKKDDIVFDTTPESSPDAPGVTYSATDPYRQTGPDGRPIWGGDLLAGWIGYGFHNDWTGMLNTTLKVSPSAKLTLSAQRSGSRRAPFDPQYRYSQQWGIPKKYQDAWTFGVPVEGGDIINDSDLIYGTGFVDFRNETNIVEVDNRRFSIVWTHQLSQRAFYSIRAAYHDYRRTMRVERWVNEAGYHATRWFYHERLAAGQGVLWQPDDEMTQVTLQPMPWIWGLEENRRNGYAPFQQYDMINKGSDRYYENQFDISRTVKGAITSQLTTHHQVKAGFEYNRLSLELLDHQLPYKDEMRYHFRKSPWELGVFLQDKLEFDQLIVNVGARYDAWFIPDTPYGWYCGYYVPGPCDDDWGGVTNLDPFDPEVNPVRSQDIRMVFSPRLSVSHPLSERGVVYGNYGLFHQQLSYRAFWIGYDGYQVDEEGVAGNPFLEPGKSSQYEFGLKQMLNEFIAVEIAFWGKRSSMLAGTVQVPGFYRGTRNPWDYSVAVNNGYANSSGFDCTVSKRYSNYFSARVHYSFTRTETNWDYLLEGYHDQYMVGSIIHRRVSRWDRPHRLRATVNLMVPAGIGPDILGIKPLERLSVGLTWRASSGWPYTPVHDGQASEPFSDRMPWTSQCDLKIYRDFVSLGKIWSLFADIRNLLDRRSVYSVFSATGQADDPGQGATIWSDHYDRSWYYGSPRTINLGMRVFF